MAVLTTVDLSMLEEVVRRLLEMDRDLERLQQERDALRREVEGYRTVLHLAVTQLRDLTLRQQSGGQA
jgi:hypothetical protein